MPLPTLTEAGTSRTVAAMHTTLHYHEAGDGPPVVLLHSWGPGTTAWITWHKVLPALAEHFRCIAVDAPNFAKSGPLYTTESIHTMQASAALAVMDALDVPRARIVANSQGSQSALQLTARAGERVDRLVVGAHHLGTTGGEYLLGLDDEEGIKAGLVAHHDPTPANMRAYLETHINDRDLITDELIDYLIDQHTSRPEIAAARDAMSYGEDHDLTAEMMRFTCPTLVIWGRNDRVCNVEIGIRTMNLIPRSRLIVLRDTGHWAPYERPDEYAAHVVNFLKGNWA
jgi:2-hydroxy-6-oxonona-2,4-dienedioate hydrolase